MAKSNVEITGGLLEVLTQSIQLESFQTTAHGCSGSLEGTVAYLESVGVDPDQFIAELEGRAGFSVSCDCKCMAVLGGLISLGPLTHIMGDQQGKMPTIDMRIPRLFKF